MKRINAILLAAIALTIGGGIYAASEPAKWEFRNAQAGNDLSVLEFKAIATVSTQPTTKPDPTGDYKTQICRVCTVEGVPLANMLVQAIQYRGSSEILADQCVTNAEGICCVTIEAAANGRIQVADSDPKYHVILMGKVPADQVGPCQPTSIPSQ